MNNEDETDDVSTDETEWLIHRFYCPDCGAETRADRAVNCFRCGSMMETDEWEIGTVTDGETTETEEADR